MNRFSAAWSALIGKAAAPGEIYGDDQTINAVHGLLGGAVPFGSPPKRGERELMVAGKKHPILHSILSRLGHDIGSTPWQLYVARGKDGAPQKRWAMRAGDRIQRKAYRTVQKTGQLRDDIEEILDHPLLDLLQQFNPLMPALIGFEVVQTYLELKGEAFLGIERNRAGMPVQLWPIPGYWIFRTPYRGSPFYHVNFGTWVADLPEEDVIWLKHPDPENPYWRGCGIGESLGDEIEIDEYAAKTQKALFYNHGVPAGVVALEGASQIEVDRAKETFNQKYGGFWNAAKLFWTGHKMDIKPLALDFVDSDIGPLREAERDKIVSTWGIPPEILGILKNSNRATIAEAKPIYAEHVMVPRLEFLRTLLQGRLVPEFDERLVLDYVDPTPDDQAFRLQVATAAPWSRSKNEWRELQALHPIDGGDDVFPPMPSGGAGPAGGGGGMPALPGGKGADPEWVKDLAAMVRRAEEEEGAEEDDYLERRDLSEVVDAVEDAAVTDPLAKMTREEMAKWVKSVADETGLQIDFQLVNPKIAAYVKERSLDKVKGLAKVNDTTRDQLRASLSEGIEKGEGIRELAARVGDVFEDAQGYRATAIARTETTRAAGFGNVTAFKEGGITEKEWVATPGPRTRDDHADMDGQVVGIDDAFTTPGGLEGDHPGDFDDPAEDCNCRCTVVAAEKAGSENDDEEGDKAASYLKRTLERRATAWKFFDAATKPWEAKARETLQRGFGVQERAVLAALKKAGK